MTATRRMTRAVGLLVVAVTVTAVGAAAQSRIRTDVDTTLVTVGDRIILTVTVEHPAGTRVAWPDSLDLGSFEVLGAQALQPRGLDGRTVSGLRMSLAAFELGEIEIPSFDVSVLGPADEVEVLQTDRYGVEVVSVGADESGDIRDIRGPLGIPVSVLGLGLLLLAALLAGALLVVGYRRFRRRDGGETSGVRGPPPRPAHELALEALAELAASPLLERGQVKEYHIAVSEILRTYVERRFRVDALEMTTREVLAGLADAGVADDFRDGLGRFLDQCDMVKFAKVRPGAEASAELLSLGRELVQSTIPSVPIPDVDVEDAA